MLKSNGRPISPVMIKAAVSGLILVTLSLQAYTAVLRMACNSVKIPIFCEIPKDPSLYPFLDYPMYSRVKGENVAVRQYILTARFANGTEKKLTAEDFGVTAYWFNRGLIQAFRNKDIDTIQQYVEDYERIGNPPFVAINVDNRRINITKAGVIEQPPERVMTFSKQSLLRTQK